MTPGIIVTGILLIGGMLWWGWKFPREEDRMYHWGLVVSVMVISAAGYFGWALWQVLFT